MPLDGHSYLMAQGWEGKGSGLRQGAISNPIIVVQKKTLSGIGKDRDEAFPFWDHLFSAAAKAVKIKCLSDDEDEDEGGKSDSDLDSDSDSPPSADRALRRTTTGILSNRRPTIGAHVTHSSGSNTPESSSSPSLSLLAQAKREAARQGLYSRFFRGPVLGPEAIIEEEKRLSKLASDAFEAQEKDRAGRGLDADAEETTQSVTVHEHISVKTAEGDSVEVDLEVIAAKSSSKGKRKAEDSDDDSRKKRRKELKAAKKEKREKREKKERKAEKSRRKEERVARKADKADKNRLKEEKKAAKLKVDAEDKSDPHCKPPKKKRHKDTVDDA